MRVVACFTGAAPAVGVKEDSVRAAPVMSTESALEGVKPGSKTPLREANKKAAPAVKKTPAKKQQVGGGNSAVPEALTQTLGHIVGQLDVLTKSMSLIEDRLSMNEARTENLIGVVGQLEQSKKGRSKIAK